MNPLKLELKDTFSHKHSVVDFSKLAAVTLVVGERKETGASNGVGKSSIFEALVWCVFGKCRATTLADVVRNGNPMLEADVMFEFEHNNIIYRIIRKADVNATKSVDLKMNSGGKWKSLTGKHKADTQKLIEDVVGSSYEVFRNSVYFQQGHLDNFCQLTASGRKKVFEEMQGLDIWDTFRDKAKDIHDKNKDKIQSIGGALHELRCSDLDEEQLKSSSKEAERNISQFKDNVKSLKTKLTELQRAKDKLGPLEELGEQLGTYGGLVDSSKSKLQSLKTKLETLRTGETNHKNILVEINSQIEVLKQNIQTLKNQEIRSEEEISSEINIQREEKTKRNTLIDTLDSVIEKELGRLLLMKEGDKCYVCESNLSDAKKKEIEESVVKFTEKSQNEIETSKKEIESFEVLWRELEKELNEAKDIRRDLDTSEQDILRRKASIESTQSELKSIQDQISDCRQRAVDEKKEYGDLLKKLSDVKNKIILYETDSSIDINAELKSTQTNLDLAEKHIEEWQTEAANIKAKLTQLTEAKVKMKKYEDELQAVMFESSLYDEIMKIFGSGGIPFEIMKKALQDLEVETNSVLKELSSGNQVVRFTTFKFNKDGSVSATSELGIEIYDGRRWRKVTTFSGGEQALISIAIRVGLSKILMMYSQAHFNMLFIDEGLGSLDDLHKDKVVALINYLSKAHRVLVITHMSDLRPRFESVLKVEMNDGISSVV